MNLMTSMNSTQIVRTKNIKLIQFQGLKMSLGPNCLQLQCFKDQIVYLNYSGTNLLI